MIQYEEFTKWLVEVAERHPNIRFVKFDTDIDAVNSPKFVAPAFVISPATSTLMDNSVTEYGFQLLYLDKLREEGDNYDTILESGLQILLGYVAVVDLDYKIVKPIPIEPVLIGYDGGMLAGQQAVITIQDQYNIEKYMSVFYATN